MALSVRLVVEPGPGVGDGALFLLGGQDATIGRDPSCDLVIESPTISGRHGLLRAGGVGYDFTDTGSSNGSAVLRAGARGPEVLATGEPTPITPGDILLLGSADAPVRIRVEAGAAPFQAAPGSERTVLASAPLADLLTVAPDPLVALVARAMAAGDARTLAATAHAYLKTLLPHADAHAVLITGAGLTASVGDTPPAGLARVAASRREVVLFEESGEALPMTESIARAGLRAAVVAPLLASDSWHGLLAAWTSQGAGALPSGTMESLSIAASLVALSAASLAIRHEGEETRKQLERENHRLREGATGHKEVIAPIGMSPPFIAAVDLCRTVAPATVPVLLLGETGTGKEVLARALHRWSPRSERRFVAFNCAAVPETLLESELFGHVRGAFTGAGRDKAGLFEDADQGTVFLDEIGEMPAAMQAKLLRVLQDGEVRRVGATRVMKVDVRVISATHRDLRAHVEAGTFRADLMYRLNAVTVRIPPLRERGDDLALLAHELLGRVCRRSRKRMPGFTPEALWALSAHDWPGNVRELENEIVRGVALTREGGAIAPAVFSDAVSGRRQVGASAPVTTAPVAPTTLREAVEQAERRTVEAALTRTGGNISAASRQLGLTRPGLYKVMERIGLR